MTKYFSWRRYGRSLLEAAVVISAGLLVVYLSRYFGGAVVMGIGFVIVIAGMILFPMYGYRTSDTTERDKHADD